MASCCSSPLPPSPACVDPHFPASPPTPGLAPNLVADHALPMPPAPCLFHFSANPPVSPQAMSLSAFVHLSSLSVPCPLTRCLLSPHPTRSWGSPLCPHCGLALAEVPAPPPPPPSVPMNDTSDSLWLPGWQHRVGASFAASLLILVSLSTHHCPPLTPRFFL